MYRGCWVLLWAVALTPTAVYFYFEKGPKEGWYLAIIGLFPFLTFLLTHLKGELDKLEQEQDKLEQEQVDIIVTAKLIDMCKEEKQRRVKEEQKRMLTERAC